VLSLFFLVQIICEVHGLLSSGWRVAPRGYSGRVFFTTHRHLVQRLRMHEPYIHSHILLRDVVRKLKYAIYFVTLSLVVYTITSNYDDTNVVCRLSDRCRPALVRFLRSPSFSLHPLRPVYNEQSNPGQGLLSAASSTVPYSVHTRQTIHKPE
jgi:hypothetical protein